MKNKWKVPYLDLPAQYKEHKKNIDSEFQRVMSEGSFILRKDVEKFEKNISKYLGVKYVIGVNSGTDALYLTLKALNIKPGDEVITISLVPYAVFAILNVGATPVLIDVNRDFNMDASKIEQEITSKTRAIIPVHLCGRACKMDEIMRIAKKYNLLVIEDSAPSIGAKYKNKCVGTFGDIGCFSTHPMKNLSCAGDGGFIVTNHKKFAEKLKILRNLGKPGRIESIDFGYNSRLDNLQAAILNIKIKTLPEWIKKRRAIAKEYNKKLSDLPLCLPKPSFDSKDYFFDTYNSYVICTPYQKELYDYLIKNKIEVFIQWTKPVYKLQALNLINPKLHVTESLCNEQIFIPIYPSLTINKQDYIINTIHKFFREKDKNKKFKYS